MNPHREAFDAKLATEVASKFKEMADLAIANKEAVAKSKAKSKEEKFLQHCLRKIKNAAAEGQHYIDYSGRIFLRMNAYDLNVLELALILKGFKCAYGGTHPEKEYLSLRVYWKEI